VNFEVEPATDSRTGTIAINDTRVTVFQESDPCNTLTFNSAKILSLNDIQPAPTPAFIAEDFNNALVSCISGIRRHGQVRKPALHLVAQERIILLSSPSASARLDRCRGRPLPHPDPARS
jgi:hypothetical protein